MQALVNKLGRSWKAGRERGGKPLALVFILLYIGQLTFRSGYIPLLCVIFTGEHSTLSNISELNSLALSFCSYETNPGYITPDISVANVCKVAYGISTLHIFYDTVVLGLLYPLKRRVDAFRGKPKGK